MDCLSNEPDPKPKHKADLEAIKYCSLMFQDHEHCDSKSKKLKVY